MSETTLRGPGARPIDAPTDFLGHPPALPYLFATEMWERFSYYGMRALLTLYLVKYVLLPENAGAVIGLEGFKRTLEALYGRLDAEPFAALIYGYYTAFVYLTPIGGGFLADRVLGHRRTVILGASLMAIGHFMMAFEHLLLFALLALILGNGAFKPNMSAQVGELYPRGDPRRDRAYSIFYVGINLGALLAPLVCGTLGELFGWRYGFAAAGVGMLIGLGVYLYASPKLPPDRVFTARTEVKQPLTREERRAIAALLILFVPTSLFWATFEQQGNVPIVLWADQHTDRTINLLFWTAEIPTTWFQAFNPFMILAFTPLVVAMWARQARRGTEPSTLTKMAFGCFGCAIGYAILAMAAAYVGPAKASWLWLLAYFAIMTLGELYLSPIGLSLVSKVAPARYLSMMMGVWLATSFVGNLLAGYLASLWSSMEKPAFFAMLAAIVAAAGVAFLLFNQPLRAALRH
jgi:proton-dependent oligopeptide transporter, POT family